VQCNGAWYCVLQCGTVRYSLRCFKFTLTHQVCSVCIVHCGEVWCWLAQCGAVWCSVMRCGVAWFIVV